MPAILYLVSIAVAALILYPLYEYFRDPNHLRRFPAAHSIAAVTDFWIVSKSLTRKRYKHVEAAHARLGPVVRLAPNHVSFADPAAFKAIYGHGVDIIKDDYYTHAAGRNVSMAQTTSRQVHATKRRWLSNVFSAKEIVAMEPRVQERVEMLLRSLKIKAEGGMVAETDEYGWGRGLRRCSDGKVSFDVRPWMNMLSWDAITAMFWSNSYGCLERGSDLVIGTKPNGDEYWVHAMASFHGTTSFVVPLAQLSASFDATAKRILKYTRGSGYVDDFGNMVRYLVTHRIASPPEKADLFSSMPMEPSPKRPEPVPLSEIMAECSTMLDAGNDTTQTSLTNALYLMALYPETQNKLRDVLERELADAEKPVPSYQRVQHIPYLRAILDEAFRVRPPVQFGLPRKTVSTTIIAGHEIAPGVTISSSVRSLHHDSSLFTDPQTFIPERWLLDSGVFPDERRNLKDFVLPFSLGGRACIGRNLAYMELSIVIAAIVLTFQWELDEDKHGGDKGLEIIERQNSNPKELWLKAQAI